MTGQPRSFYAGRRAQKDVAKYLLEDEPAIIATRRHWAVLVAPTAKALPVVLAGGWLFLLDPGNRVTSLVGLVVVVGALGWLGLRAGGITVDHALQPGSAQQAARVVATMTELGLDPAQAAGVTVASTGVAVRTSKCKCNLAPRWSWSIHNAQAMRGVL